MKNRLWRISDSEDLLAPNGKPSNLTSQQYEQVRTDVFKAWFGDWENNSDNASKIVDENGEPMVVYHGAYDGGFSVFDKKMRGTATNAKSAKKGFFFTDSKEWANEYARRSANGELYEVYLNIKNPLVYDFNNDKVNADVELTKLINRAYSNGCDGVIAINLKDGFEVHNQYVAFFSNQIKSATNNKGTFNPNSDNINDSHAVSVLVKHYPNASANQIADFIFDGWNVNAPDIVNVRNFRKTR